MMRVGRVRVYLLAPFLGRGKPTGGGLSPCSCSGTRCVSTNWLGLVCVPSIVILCWGSVVYCSPKGWELCEGCCTPRALCPSRLCWDTRIETLSVLRTCCSSSESEIWGMPCLAPDIPLALETGALLGTGNSSMLIDAGHTCILFGARHTCILFDAGDSGALLGARQSCVTLAFYFILFLGIQFVGVAIPLTKYSIWCGLIILPH